MQNKHIHFATTIKGTVLNQKDLGDGMIEFNIRGLDLRFRAYASMYEKEIKKEFVYTLELADSVILVEDGLNFDFIGEDTGLVSLRAYSVSGKGRVGCSPSPTLIRNTDNSIKEVAKFKYGNRIFMQFTNIKPSYENPIFYGATDKYIAYYECTKAQYDDINLQYQTGEIQPKNNQWGQEDDPIKLTIDSSITPNTFPPNMSYIWIHRDMRYSK